MTTSRNAELQSMNPSRLFWLLLRTHARQSWRKLSVTCRQSRLLAGFIALFVVSYLFVAFLFFHFGFHFVNKFPGLGALLIERLMYLMFAFLFVLLLFSNLIIAYTNFFRNRESSYLFSLPIPHGTIFLWKFVESLLLSSWAFIFLVSPFLLAYGLNQGASVDFYPAALVMVVIFIMLPGSLGAWFAVNLARFMDRKAFQVTLLLVVLGILIGGGFWLQPEQVTDESLEFRVLAVMDRLMAKTEFSQAAFLPSYWLSSGMLLWSEGAFQSAVFFLLVMLSYVLFFGMLLCTRMGHAFFDGASAVQSRGTWLGNWVWWQRKAAATASSHRRPCGLEKFMVRVPFLDTDARALIIKDMRLFWRDTSQWGQSLVLFGLLGVYVINLRQFSQQLTNPFWLHLIAFLNLGACTLNLATLTTRFVYPQFSLEGRRLWIIGMSPMGMPRVVRVKFWLMSITSLLLTLGLVFLSCLMLNLAWGRILYFSAAITIMTFTLNGMAVGLGVLHPNFKEDNPGKIVSGFGGTLCLVLSFLYTVGSVVLLAIGSPRGIHQQADWPRAILCYGLFLVISFALGWIPMRLGLRKVISFEI